MIDLAYAHQAFDEYLKAFDLQNEKIKIKVVHTDGVIACASEIARRMGLSEEDRQLAQLIALLHDIGRFEQLKQFDSYERVHMDHAAFGVDLLFSPGATAATPVSDSTDRKSSDDIYLRSFIKDDSYDQIIRHAIARHSDYSVGDGLSERELLHARLIRDADKLDNCRVKLVDSVEVIFGVSPEVMGSQNISPHIWEECLNRQSVHLEKRKTRMDYWVSHLAYFFDIQFPETMDIIHERQYIDRIAAMVPYSNKDTAEKMKLLRQMLHEYSPAV